MAFLVIACLDFETHSCSMTIVHFAKQGNVAQESCDWLFDFSMAEFLFTDFSRIIKRLMCYCSCYAF